MASLLTKVDGDKILAIVFMLNLSSQDLGDIF